jgi:hypothetical protein
VLKSFAKIAGHPPMDERSLFLSYNSADRSTVVAIQRLLEARGICTFLDRDRLIPGLPWPKALEEGLRSASGVAVFLGHELGGWQKREMWFALDRQVREEKEGRPFPVIPVLLGGADLTAGFLFSGTWIDLSKGLDAANVSESLDLFERSIHAAGPAAPAVRETSICPYRGLEAFREKDAAFFFGRASFAQQLSDFTVGKNLVAIVGPSGSGKSSIIQAGLIPFLRRKRPPAPTWDAITFTPGDAPLNRLASALIPLIEPDLRETERLAEAQRLGDLLTSGKIRLEAAIDSAIQKSEGTGRLLLIADQFEEVFTLTPEPDRRPFVQALMRALGKAPFTLLVTLRADFYSQIITLDRDLSDRIAPAQINIGALNREELRETIVAPAKLVGLECEAGLVDRILLDVGSEPGNLPLLEFALTDLWSRRKGRTLTNAAYYGIGGVTGALAQRAETEFSNFTAEEQAAARRLFSGLVRVATPEEGSEDTRQRVDLKEADPLAMKVAQALSHKDVRLLVMGRPKSAGASENQTVEVAHEALIRNWERLRQWLNEDREFLLWRQRVQIRVSEWEQHGRASSELLRGASLSEAERWLGVRPRDLTEVQAQFIAESTALHERERADEEQRRRTELENAERQREAAEAKAALEEQRREVAEAKVVTSYFGLRRATGIVALILPFALIIGNIVFTPLGFAGEWPHPLLEGSISAYYYTCMGHFFTGALCIIAACLMFCQGYDRLDETAGYLACVFTLGVAFCPPTPDRPPLTPLQNALGWAHEIFVALMFLVLAYFCFFLFTRTSGYPTRRKLQRNMVYKVCGSIMIVSMVILSSIHIPAVGRFFQHVNLALIFETMCFGVFGVAWLIKGGALLKDQKASGYGTVSV